MLSECRPCDASVASDARCVLHVRTYLSENLHVVQAKALWGI